MREYKQFKNYIATLYNNKKFVKNIDYEMWNAYTIKYQAKIANMMLNRNTLRFTERMYLFAFCNILDTPLMRVLRARKTLQGYVIGIRQICSTKVSVEQKRILMKNWWTRITKK